MAISIGGKNYLQISSCDTTAAGGSWNLGAPDPEQLKEGLASLCGTFKNAGATDATFTPSADVNLSGTKHLRMWFIGNQGAKLETLENGGVQIGVSSDAGANYGWYYVCGRNVYPGGWYNLVVDVSRTVDSGVKPSLNGGMANIDRIIFRVNLTLAVKNAVNTWWDNLCVCDGLVAYGDDAGGYFDLDDIYTADNATTGGWGVLRKIGGQYFSTGSFDIGTAASATKFQAKSQVLVFEDRKVNNALYGFNIIDSGNASFTTEFILGSKSGTAGIEGCMIRVQDSAQTCKFFIDGATDTDVDNFKLYGTTFFDAGAISVSAQIAGKASVHRARNADVATLGVTAHGLIVGNYIEVSGLAGTGYNGLFTVVSVPDADHFTYANTGDNEGETADTAGTITSKNVEALNCNFESCAEVLPSTGVVKYCNFVSANSRGIRYGTNVTYCNFISCAIGVNFVVATTYTIYGLIFTNCTYDVENSVAGLVTIQNDNPSGSNALTHTETGGGTMAIQNSVTLSFHVVDESNNDVVGARIYVEKASDNTQLMNELTIAGGIATESYTSTLPMFINVNIRKSSSEPKYFPMTTSGQITTDGYNLTAVLIADSIA